MAVAKRQAETRFPGDFYSRHTIEELARMQGVRPVESFESLLGGWPADEIDDGFEAAVAGWRGQPISAADGWVAATAVWHGVPLVTHNLRNFRHVDGLSLISVPVERG